MSIEQEIAALRLLLQSSAARMQNCTQDLNQFVEEAKKTRYVIVEAYAQLTVAVNAYAVAVNACVAQNVEPAGDAATDCAPNAEPLTRSPPPA